MRSSAGLRYVAVVVALAAAAIGCGGHGGAGGVVVPARSLALSAPVGPVGRSGVALTATFVGSRPPSSVQVVVGSDVVASLASTGASSGGVVYAGRYVPAPGISTTLALVARATIDDGAVVESPPLELPVDTAAASVLSVTAACGVARADGKCRRHDPIEVSARIDDPQDAVVTATLDLDGGAQPVLLVGSGDVRNATISMERYPFPAFEGPVIFSVTAADSGGNRSAPVLASVTVTRLRWDYDTGGTSVTSPASNTHRTLAFGVTGTPGRQFRTIRAQCDPTQEPAPSPPCVTELDVGANVTVPPTITSTQDGYVYWVPTAAGRLLAISEPTGAVLNGGGAGCALGPPAAGPVSLTPRVPPTVVLNTASGGGIFAVDQALLCDRTRPSTDAYASGSAVAWSGRVYSVSNAAPAVLRALESSPEFGDLAQAWSLPVGTNVAAPPIIDRQGRVIVSSSDGTIHRVTDGGTAGTAAQLATRLEQGATASPVILADDSIVAGAGSLLVRIADGGGAVWPAPRDLGAAITGIAAVARDASGVELYVTTAGGGLFALRADGTEAWSAPALAGAALSFPGFTVTDGWDHLVLGAADGHLRSVLVDTAPTSRMPWPKAYRTNENWSLAVPALPNG